MIKDFQNKKVLAEMKRQLNKAAKQGDREARITFTLIHMISEHHELAEMASKPDGENNLYRFMWWNLDRMADEFELKPEDEYSNPIDIYRREEQLDLLELCRFRTPTKDAVKKGLEEWQEWPSDVPYEEWEDEMLQTAYITMFGLCNCSRCTADVKALTLNRLDPKYVVMHNGEEPPRISFYESKYAAAVTAQLIAACGIVMDKPRHDRE